MQFSVSSELQYQIDEPTTLIVSVHAMHTPSQKILDERFDLHPSVKVEELDAALGETRFFRLETGNAKHLTVIYNATVDVEHHAVKATHIHKVPISRIPASVVPYLFPSRYCPSDQLGRLAWDKFGNIPRTYDRVVALTDWIHRNVEYLPGCTNSSTSAYDTIIQRAGVCRDFAHLGIALCRALTIPARYCTAYAYSLHPPDFHALFEAYIGNRWILFDATRLAPLNGIVRIGTGRDAADAAVATLFGRAQGTSVKVTCTHDTKKFKPIPHERLKNQAISLDADH